MKWKAVIMYNNVNTVARYFSHFRSKTKTKQNVELSISPVRTCKKAKVSDFKSLKADWKVI